MRDYSEAAAIELTPQRYPALAHLLLTMRPDLGAAVDAAKPIHGHPRPFLRDSGPVCQDKALLAPQLRLSVRTYDRGYGRCARVDRTAA